MGKETFDFPVEYVIRDLCKAELKRDVPTGAGELSFRCPVRGDKFVDINVANGGIWHCFRNCANCPAESGGGILDFYRLFYDVKDRGQALAEIMKSLETTDNKARSEKRKKEAVEPRKMEETASPEQRDAAYRTFLKALTLSAAHRQDLLNRGMSEEDIENMGFRSLPQSGFPKIIAYIRSKGVDLKGVPGFYLEKDKYKINLYGSGYFIPYRDRNGYIVALQIRKDVVISNEMTEEQIREAKQRRYRWFTSSDKDGGASASNVPFYGLPGKPRQKVAYATEGGLKAATAQSITGDQNSWFVAIPGVSCFGAWIELLTFLKENGITTLVDAFDADRDINPNVKNNIDKLHEIAKEQGFEMKTWKWNSKDTFYKGVDDFLLSKHKRR